MKIPLFVLFYLIFEYFSPKYLLRIKIVKADYVLVRLTDLKLQLKLNAIL